MKQHPNWIATFGKTARRDKSVPAIVAGTCDNRDPRSEWMPLRDNIRNRAAGIGHEGRAGNAGRDCQAISFRHLIVGQQLNHRGQTRLPVRSTATFNDHGTDPINIYAVCLMNDQMLHRRSPEKAAAPL
jgi:hypothetical protein